MKYGIIGFQNKEEEVTRYRKSLIARLVLEPEKQEIYKEVKTELLSYHGEKRKRVRARLTFKGDRVYVGRKTLARIHTLGKRIYLYLALDPQQFENTKYRVFDVSDKKIGQKTPCLIKVKSKRSILHAKQLIKQLMRLNELEKDIEPFVFNYDEILYDRSLDKLIEEGQVKEYTVIRKNRVPVFGWSEDVIREITEEEYYNEQKEPFFARKTEEQPEEPVIEVEQEVVEQPAEEVVEEIITEEEPVEEVLEEVIEEPQEEVQFTEESVEQPVEEVVEEIITEEEPVEEVLEEVIEEPQEEIVEETFDEIYTDEDVVYEETTQENNDETLELVEDQEVEYDDDEEEPIDYSTTKIGILFTTMDNIIEEIVDEKPVILEEEPKQEISKVKPTNVVETKKDVKTQPENNVLKPKKESKVRVELTRHEKKENRRKQEEDLNIELKYKELNRTGKLSIINIDVLSHNFNDGDTITLDILKQHKLVPKNTMRIKVLSRGYLDKKLHVEADEFSKAAMKTITFVGGTVTIVK